MASRTPSPRSIRPSVGAAIRRTLNIGWPLNMVVNTKGELVPFTHTFQTPSLAPAAGDSSTVSCSTEYSPNGENGVLILLDLGYPETLDLKIFNQFSSSRPSFSRFRDAADRQSRSTLDHDLPHHHHRTSRAHPNILPIHSSETASPAAINTLANFLDQPGGHNVFFCFSDRKHLYVDRYVLQRASPHFRHLFAVRNRESGIVPGVGFAIDTKGFKFQ
ncbi:hypothetical protein FRC00_010771, partial [Tulasnella sp. 408]